MRPEVEIVTACGIAMAILSSVCIAGIALWFFFSLQGLNFHICSAENQLIVIFNLLLVVLLMFYHGSPISISDHLEHSTLLFAVWPS